MELFPHLSILISIVLGLGIARVLTGFGRLLQVRHRFPVYWVHLVWALNLFLFLILNWWILFRWQTQAEWTFFLFIFVLLSPTVSFLLAERVGPFPCPGTHLCGHDTAADSFEPHCRNHPQ